jgi:hypothetical protein
VPGAIAIPGLNSVSLPTFYNSDTTDIREDFSIESPVVLRIPENAEYLMLGPNDSYYSDNSDPNFNFGFRMTLVAESPTQMLFVVGIIFAMVGQGMIQSRSKVRSES